MRLNPHFTLIAILLTFACLISPVRADSADAEVLDIPRVDGSVTIDGRLDESVWKQAAEFTMNEPVGADTLPRGWASSVRIGRDAAALFFGFRIENPDIPRFVNARPRGRDASVYSDECIEIFVNTGAGRPTTRQFIVSAYGSQYDGEYDLGRHATSTDWNGTWEAATLFVRGAWYAELRIPYTDLGNVESILINCSRASYNQKGEKVLSAWRAPGWFQPSFKIRLAP